MDQVTLSLVIGRDDTSVQKVAMELCVFLSQVLVLRKKSLKYASVGTEYNQILNSYFREQVGVLHILINKPVKTM